MQDIYNRVAKWNSLRYEQEYDAQLTHTLLVEEYSEWIQAPDQVNDIKELADIVYVALGALWKLDVNDEEAQASAALFLEGLLNQSELMPGFFVGALLDQNAVVYAEDQVKLMHNIIGCALAQMQCIGLGQHHCVAVLNAVCDSNDTKTVKKTASDVKANDKDKGHYYRPAEPKIRLIMETAKCLSKTH